MKRREFLMTSTAAGAVALSTGLMGGRAFAAPGVLDVFFNSDVNVVDFWTMNVKPGFEAANPGVTLNLVSGGGGAQMNAIADRAMAALQTATDPQVDFMEAMGPYYPAGAIDAGLWVDFSTAGLSNFGIVNPVVMESKWALPYRGSQVVMFYNSEKIATPPSTFEELTAWIKANPGRFAYARPDVGDSGACFIERALQEVMGKDLSLFTNDNFTPEYAEPMFAKLWAYLNDIAPSLYGEGQYTGGNTPSIQLLASGAVDMTIAWSDMALEAMRKEVVPPSAAVAQLKDLAFVGGFSGVVVPNSAANKDLALKLADYVISPEVQNKVVSELGGFPGINWEAMDPELQAKFKDVAPTSIPSFPGGTWEPPLFDGWYRNVGVGLSAG
ncbi:extracellular solute-binding protein [Devosia sp. SL43]|uniref:extracellular solute-binding protein n=1 Tax=Devosia sp. SL43 TaxID=2806348 RepID=UPI001F3E18DA|nr:extracellular solute-binding protein [Devosia sp. SL43]UJW84639.1 extracellular solute-binding protein [Devosia sp. SL43]